VDISGKNLPLGLLDWRSIMEIGTNPTALLAIKGVHSANAAVLKASERISTGLRVNRASDDPTGLSVANKLKTQILSMSKAIENLSQGTATTQIVDSSLSEIADLLSYMRVAAVAAESSTLSSSDRTGYQDAIDAYVDEIDSISSNAVYNDISLMNTASTVSIQASAQSGDTISVSFETITASELAVDSLDVSTAAGASSAVDYIDDALDTVNAYQSYMGAMSNVMTAQSDALSSFTTTYSTAYGNIMNADMAQETANLANAQIQLDASTAILAQSNSMNKELVSYLLKSVD
jgi:flagellin